MLKQLHPDIKGFQELMREAIIIAEKKVEKTQAIEIAIEMLADGEPIDKIIKYTKLTEEEIKDIQV